VDKRLRKIKMLIMDVDGVLTDCRVFMDSEGKWRRFFSIRDGYGIQRLIEGGYKTGVITGSQSEDIQSRVKALKIHYFSEGSMDKLPAFNNILQETGLQLEEIAYIGDDLFDIPILEQVGFAATVSDAMEPVLKVAHYVCKRPAGNGAVREVCEMILDSGSLRHHQ
jgi:3-deoxy-D-manno-octulosonate 8-phosphate phosphatase (KDO 8-P phosphatase)